MDAPSIERNRSAPVPLGLEAFSLAGKTALVTGCRRGIGEAMALALAEAGANIIGVSSCLESESEIGGRVAGLGRDFVPYRCDLRLRTELFALVERVKSEIGVVDVIVNNAGVIRRAPAADHDDETWDAIVELDLTAPFLLTRELGRAMLARGSGKVIFTASLLSFQGGVNVVSYAAAKGGVAQLTKALSNEWAPHGVNVNAIAPGYIATDSTRPLIDDAVRQHQIVERIPAGRWGEPSDIKGATVFLASPASDYVHGTILTVDGGWMAR